MLLFFLRHGDPIYSPDSLTPLGRRQAEALARRLARYGVDQIFASSSKRAMETAQPACEMMKKEMTVLDWCNEAHAWAQLALPGADGKTNWMFSQEKWRALFVSEEVRALGRAWYTHPAFRDTQAQAGILRIQREADAFLAALGYAHDLEKNMYFSEGENARRVALFAHQGFGMAFLSCVLDIPYPQFSTHFDMGHSGMTVLEFPEKPGWSIPRALQISNDSHLYESGLPTYYQNRLFF